MSVRIVRLGTPRHPHEGLRLGTVRRPPRGVPKSEFAAQNWYDVWFPNLAPSLASMQQALRAENPAQWNAFVRSYRKEMAAPAATHDLELLARLSHTTDFSVGCYCEDESHCHRSILRELLRAHGASFADDDAPPAKSDPAR
ncbi:DUF488 family protein [Opitutus sp. ER46]|uniref:DUF488 domain-containing protein n=1 Tax=Opitutus sp. ER46 TaxID=2161864 RepID=UPI000D320BF6|nr:DUF488 family protein [Opitutus sp. ER46]PTX91758.1 DUF488 domain-containing protein [Opitutus sp. ER46]